MQLNCWEITKSSQGMAAGSSQWVTSWNEKRADLCEQCDLNPCWWIIYRGSKTTQPIYWGLFHNPRTGNLYKLTRDFVATAHVENPRVFGRNWEESWGSTSRLQEAYQWTIEWEIVILHCRSYVETVCDCDFIWVEYNTTMKNMCLTT